MKKVFVNMFGNATIYSDVLLNIISLQGKLETCFNN